jgi:uncharacterized membrane protein
MAHERIEINLPLAKVYELMSTPTEFPKYITSLKEVIKLSSQSFEYVAEFGGEEYRWTTNVIDDLRNTRFAWITINGNLNQTGTIRFTPLDNGKRTRVDFSLDYRTFFGEPTAALGTFINGLQETLKAELEKFRDMAESDGFMQGSIEAVDKEMTV